MNSRINDRRIRTFVLSLLLVIIAAQIIECTNSLSGNRKYTPLVRTQAISVITMFMSISDSRGSKGYNNTADVGVTNTIVKA
ncbi:hypothetical protein PMAYCL1PPCAC_19675, partial [Pristionchus mayeri]